MAWFYLLIAGLFEIGWAVSMKQSEGFTKLWPSVITIAGLAVSMVFLALAVKQLPVGTAYAVWTGIGAAGTALMGMLLLKESAAPARLVCIAMIVAGVIGLRLTMRSEG